MSQTQLAFDDRGADLSLDGRYRYRLWRSWGPGRRCAFVMLNPSTADADVDDPTIRRCIGFAKAWGYDGLEVANLFAFRATKPRELYWCDEGICIGPDNDDALVAIANMTHRLVCAWGNHGGLHKRSGVVLELLRRYCDPMALAATKQGQPAHPLYLPADTEPFRWDRL